MATSYATKVSNVLSEPQTSECERKSEIAEFYSGTNILITGGTGFIGKLLIEKLLRSCPGINKIYIVIRPKKGKSVEERFKENFDDVIYDKLSKDQPNFRSKIVAIEGDASEEDLGMTPEVKETLMCTNIVFHAAANVRFNEQLRAIVNTNVKTTKLLLLWAKQLRNLKAFVYVSTAFSNCVNKTIDEIHYQPLVDADKLITLVDCLDDDTLRAIGPGLLRNCPNNYILTKSATENVVLKYAGDFPVGIVRPSIVTSTYKEPIVGWINNFYGSTGVCLASSLGLMHTLHCIPEITAEIIPADHVIATIIATAWDIGNRKATLELKRKASLPDEERVPIYNTVTSTQNRLGWGDFMAMNEKHGRKVPSVKMVGAYMFLMNRYFICHQICAFFLHTVPAIIVDGIARLIGRKPMLVDAYKKIEKFGSVIHYFSTQEWNFRNDNIQRMWSKLNSVDRILFNFDVTSIDWDEYLCFQIRGIRVYLVNDPLTPESIERGLARYKWLTIAHYTILSLCLMFLIWIFVSFLLFLWSFCPLSQ